MCTLFGMLLYISSPGQVLPRLYCNLYDLFLPEGTFIGVPHYCPKIRFPYGRHILNEIHIRWVGRPIQPQYGALHSVHPYPPPALTSYMARLRRAAR